MLTDIRWSNWFQAMRKASVNMLTLAALLGHTTVQMTSRYLHPTDQHKREAQKVEDYNADVVFEYAESVSGSLQKSLQ
jgi:integrase